MKTQGWYSTHSRKRMFRIIAWAWVTMLGLSCGWNWYQVGQSVNMFAEAEARASYDKDLVYRRWAALQGGVYVPPSETTPANPYLAHLSDRDLVTVGGKRLTLVNPAYMTRQVHALGQEQYGTLGHITSLTPLNPKNTADSWETEALRRFATGEKEVVSLEAIDGQLHLRFMRPLITEKTCLKCHAAQGYKEGDIRGGISVSVPFSPYATIAQQQRKQLLLAHLLIGGLGLLGLWKGNRLLGASETALLKSEERLKSILDTALDGFCIFDTQGCILEVSQTFCQMCGYSAKELLGMRVADLQPFETENELCNRIGKILAWGEDRFESKLRCKDGNIIDVEMSIQFKPQVSEHLVAFLRDITERKRAEDALLRKDALLRAMVRNLPFDFWVRDTNQRIIMQSDESVHLWGDLTSDQPLVGQFDNQTVELWNKNNRRVLEGNIISEDCTLVIRNGEQRAFHNIVAPIRDGSAILGILGINIDITERKRAEEERKHLQAQLIQAQKMQAIGTLAGGIAHDFNNILGAVLGYAEMARDASPSESAVAKDLNKVLEAGYRAAALVKQILTFSRQGQNERVLLEPVHMVKEAIKLLRPTLPSTITIKQQFDPGVQPIFADPTQIHQIVMNLCTNAYHAMEQTGGTLEITIKSCCY
jgi:PAS domain S-box-containing protein